MLRIKLGLYFWGFNKIYHAITRLKLQKSQIPLTVEKAIITQVCGAVQKASRYLFLQTQCLEQALATYYLLQKKGIAANLCIGVRKRPFASHAWVEYRGKVINAPASTKDGFSVLLRA